MGFNYLGRVSVGDGGAMPTALGDGADGAMPMAHLLEFNAVTHDGPPGSRLVATWSWAKSD